MWTGGFGEDGDTCLSHFAHESKEKGVDSLVQNNPVDEIIL